MVVVVIPFNVRETSLTMVLALEEPPPDPLRCALELDCAEADWDEDAAVVAWDDDVAAVVEEDPMAEIDMESSPEGEIDEGKHRLAACLTSSTRLGIEAGVAIWL